MHLHYVDINILDFCCESYNHIFNLQKFVHFKFELTYCFQMCVFLSRGNVFTLVHINNNIYKQQLDSVFVVQSYTI